MPNSDVKTELQFVQTIKTITQAYQQISVMRIQRIRNKVIGTRNFIDNIEAIFQDIKKYYRTQLIKKIKGKDKKNIQNKKEKKKEVAVFVSANSRLYGDIVTKVFDTFYEYVKNNTCDIVVVGKLGKELWYQKAHNNSYTYFDIPEKEIGLDDLKKIITDISDYNTINIFHGKYESLVNQQVVISNISGDVVSSIEDQEKIVVFNYLYEPSVNELMDFFENQVFSALFKQSIQESELSKHASRIQAMELAIANIKTKERDLNREELLLRKKLYNKNQLSSLLGISLWKK